MEWLYRPAMDLWRILSDLNKNDLDNYKNDLKRQDLEKVEENVKCKVRCDIWKKWSTFPSSPEAYFSQILLIIWYVTYSLVCDLA